MGKPHAALAARRVGVRFQQAPYALEQHERPYNLKLCADRPQLESVAPKQRAEDRGDVEMGKVVVGDLDGCCVVEELADGRVALGLRRLLVLWWCRARTIGQEASAQGRDSLQKEDLVSRHISRS